MPETSELHVLITFALEPELVKAIEAVDPRIQATVLGQAARQLFRGQRKYPSELEAQTARTEFDDAMSEAEVLFGFWGPALIEMYPTADALQKEAPALRWLQLTSAGLGQTTCVGIGGDPLIGTNFIDCLEAFEADPETTGVVMLGEIGGTDEQEAAVYVSASMSKPVVGFIAGQTAPPGRRMGHAGAIISGSAGTAEEKMKAFEENGIAVAKRPADLVALIQDALN